MANALFDAGRNGFLTGDIDYLVDTIKMLCLDATYSVNLATHDNLDDIAGTARVGTAVALTTKTASAGIAGCDNITFPGITGDVVTQLVLYKDTGVESTSTLISYWDTVTGFNFTPNGGDLVLTVPTTGNKLLKL